MSVDNDDAVLAELRKLREGRGLTPDRLGNSGALTSALGTSDPQIAYQRLTTCITELGDGGRSEALRVDLGMDLTRLLGRTPATKEVDWLSARRAGYATTIGRSVKTLARWSDAALAELRAKVLTDQFTGHLFVIAGVTGDRIFGTTTIQRADDNGRPGPAVTPSVDFENPSQEPSLPCLIYGYPRDWNPASLTLVVAFKGLALPERIDAVVAPTFFELVYAVERYQITPEDGVATVRFERPRADRLYAIFWA